MPESLSSPDQERHPELPTPTQMSVLNALKRRGPEGMHWKDFMILPTNPDPDDIEALIAMGLLKERVDGYLVYHLFYDDQTGAEAIYIQTKAQIQKVYREKITQTREKIRAWKQTEAKRKWEESEEKKDLEHLKEIGWFNYI